jgi:hypothetical protein
VRVGVVDEWLADEPAGTSEEVLGEVELPGLKRGVPEGGDPDEPVAGPLGRLPELEVERLPRGGVTLPSGRVISPVKFPVTLVTTVIQSPLPNWIG